MRRIEQSTAETGVRRRPRLRVLLSLMACLVAVAAHAQDWTAGLSPWSTLGNPLSQPTLSPWSSLAAPMSPSLLSPWSGLTSPLGTATPSPWSGLAGPMTPSTYPSLPYAYGSPYLNAVPGLSSLYSPYAQTLPEPWLSPSYAGGPSSCPGSGVTESYQPDLTGTWRGSGGETVEIQRNRARIWGGQDKPCNCVFFLVGQRLIAYSPDTDMVRKYWYQGGSGSRFTLIDEAGNLLTFVRAR